MTENTIKLIKKPIIVSILLFFLSGLMAGIFYLVHLAIPLIEYPNLICFDSASILLFSLVYTFKLKEKLSFFNAFKISICFTFFVLIRAIITSIIHVYNVELSIHIFGYIISKIVITGFTLPYTFVVLKLINISGLRLLEKIDKNKSN